MAPLLLPSLLLATMPSAGGVVVFRGQPGGAGNVTIVDPSGSPPPTVPAGLAGITLLPIDTSGRAELDALRSNRAQRKTSNMVGSYLALPASQGSLYRYSTPSAAGTDFGLFVVDALGDARRVLTLPGSGALSNQSPFLSAVAVAPNGDRVLAITKPADGGNLLDIDLATGAVIDRTSGVAPQRFLVNALHYGAG